MAYRIPNDEPGGLTKRGALGSATFGSDAKYAVRSATCFSETCISVYAGMIAHGCRSARFT